MPGDTHGLQDLPISTRRVKVVRCPRCGATDAGPESRSRADLTSMPCASCGHVAPGMADAGFGCTRCAGEDGAAAWVALRGEHLRAIAAESHFGVDATRCACGQRFAIVFLERVDWLRGDDDQTWLALPLTAPESATLDACAADEVPRLLTEFGRTRRFLVRSRVADGSLGAWWRADGFAIGPHD